MDIINGAFLYIIGAVIALFVLAQSVVFLIRAVRHGKRIGLSAKVMKDAAVSSATFSVVPSIPIVLAMIALVATLGVPFSWIRLSVIGSMAYETFAAGAVANTASGSVSEPGVIAAIMWVMTLGIISGPLFNIFGLKKYQGKITDIGKKDPKWMKILVDSLFIGIIAVMGGQYVAKGIAAFGDLADKSIVAYGEAQLLTLLTGVLLMAVFGLIIKKTKAGWLENFALPISIIGAIALSAVYHGLFQGVA